jgi:hypothetical protein
LLDLEILIGIAHSFLKSVLDTLYGRNGLAAMLSDNVVLLIDFSEEVLGDSDYVGVKIKGNFHGVFSL